MTMGGAAVADKLGPGIGLGIGAKGLFINNGDDAGVAVEVGCATVAAAGGCPARTGIEVVRATVLVTTGDDGRCGLLFPQMPSRTGEEERVRGTLCTGVGLRVEESVAAGVAPGAVADADAYGRKPGAHVTVITGGCGTATDGTVAVAAEGRD